MSGSIRLHPTLGVNPHMACCPRCGRDNGELVLIGAATGIWMCGGCNHKIYGGSECPNCRSRAQTYQIGRVGERDKIPTSLCKECEDEVKLHRQIVAEGGVYFKCKQCSATGVVKAGTALAKMVREDTKIAPPDPVGCEFESCEQHGVSKEAERA